MVLAFVRASENHDLVSRLLRPFYDVLVVQGGNSIGFLDRLTDRLKMGDGLKMSDFGLGML